MIMSKYGDFFDPYFTVFGLNTETYGKQENTDQKKFRIWTLLRNVKFYIKSWMSEDFRKKSVGPLIKNLFRKFERCIDH